MSLINPPACRLDDQSDSLLLRQASALPKFFNANISSRNTIVTTDSIRTTCRFLSTLSCISTLTLNRVTHGSSGLTVLASFFTSAYPAERTSLQRYTRPPVSIGHDGLLTW